MPFSVVTVSIAQVVSLLDARCSVRNQEESRKRLLCTQGKNRRITFGTLDTFDNIDLWSHDSRYDSIVDLKSPLLAVVRLQTPRAILGRYDISRPTAVRTVTMSQIANPG